MSDKHIHILLFIAVSGIAAYLIYRWYKNKEQASSPTGSLGSNLNSVAPELIGGSTGPSAGPAVSVPISISLTEPAAEPTSGANPTPFLPSGYNTPSPLMSQANAAAAHAGTVAPDTSAGIGSSNGVTGGGHSGRTTTSPKGKPPTTDRGVNSGPRRAAGRGK